MRVALESSQLRRLHVQGGVPWCDLEGLLPMLYDTREFVSDIAVRQRRKVHADHVSRLDR